MTTPYINTEYIDRFLSCFLYFHLFAAIHLNLLTCLELKVGFRSRFQQDKLSSLTNWLHNQIIFYFFSGTLNENQLKIVLDHCFFCKNKTIGLANAPWYLVSAVMTFMQLAMRFLSDQINPFLSDQIISLNFMLKNPKNSCFQCLARTFQW